MQPTTDEQAPPSITRRTPYQIMCDPALSCSARVAFAFMCRPLEDFGFARFPIEEIAAVIGYSMREASRTISELESAGVIVSRLGGKGHFKIFALGPVVRGGVDSDVVAQIGNAPIVSGGSGGSGGNRNAITGAISATKPTRQIKLELRGRETSEHNSASLSSSRVIVRGKLESKDDPGIANITTSFARELSSSSSSLLEKLREVPGMSAFTAERLIREYGSEVCARQLASMPAWEAHHDRKGDPIRDPGAFLMRAIEKGWTPPQRYTPKDWQIQHAERQAPIATSPAPAKQTPVESQAQIDADRAANHKRAEQYFADLTADERAAIESSAAQLAQRITGGAGLGLMRLAAIQKHANVRGILL